MTKKPTRTSKKLAPKPRAGLSQAVYETIEGLGGGTEAQIRKYLPTCITRTSQVINKKRLHTALTNCKYRGFIVHNPKTDNYSIAPISYYEVRQAHLNDMDAKRRAKGPHFKLDDQPTEEVHGGSFTAEWPLAQVQPRNWESRLSATAIIWAAILSFWTGLLVGMAL